ncbi:MAG TPA: hypothetical protein VKU02_33590, partial [Gemmataceae bacterium]|nr:hypothetical protein [Gemmataceae bacterium]
MHYPISKQTKAELLAAMRERYRRVTRAEKTKVLDEFVAVAGCHRQHAIRLLTTVGCRTTEPSAMDRRTYGEAVRQALVVLREAADRICGKRLKALLPSLITALEQHGHLALDPTVRREILSALVPALGAGSLGIFSWLARVAMMAALSFIMIQVGHEFDLDKQELRTYAFDSLVAMTAAAIPWLLCALYFVLAMAP